MFVRDLAARPVLGLGDQPTAISSEADHIANTIGEAPQSGGHERRQ